MSKKEIKKAPPTEEEVAKAIEAQRQAMIDARRWQFNHHFYLSLQGKSSFNSY